MHLCKTLCCLLLLSSQYLFAQSDNLVVNPSFEQVTVSSIELEDINPVRWAEGWSAATDGEVALYTSNDEGNIADSYGSLWPFKAQRGRHVAGIGVAGGDRAYLQGKTNQPLEVGKTYTFSFYVHYHCSGSNGIGIVFLDKPLEVDGEERLNLTPVAYQKEMSPYEQGTWQKVSGSFVAQRPFTNFVIGNFLTESKTDKEETIYGHYYAYIDNVSLVTDADAIVTEAVAPETWEENVAVAEVMEETVEDDPAIIEDEIEEYIEEDIIEVEVEVEEVMPPPPPPPRNRLNGQLADFKFAQAKSNLSAINQAELDALATTLKNNPDTHIEVIGHASTEGDTAYNFGLSAQRAGIIYDALIKRGVNPQQLSMSAKGETEPLRNEEATSAANRRVEVWVRQ